MPNQVLKLDFSQQPVAAAFVQAITTGENPLDPSKHVDEILALGPRGEGKTIGVLTGMINHAIMHQKYGFPLPVPWIGARDTFANHRNTTIKTLQKPLWGGGWQLHDGDRLAHYCQMTQQGPQEIVELRLLGLDQQQDIDKLKQEVVGLWFEEAAPSSGLVVSSGVSEEAWTVGVTSCRVPSHFKPKVITQNLPEEDHWTWERWKPTKHPVFCEADKIREILETAEVDPASATAKIIAEEARKYPKGTPWYECVSVNPDSAERICFRVPAGERASHEDRIAWAKSLKQRPDLLLRLIFGLPGYVQLGEPVARTGQPGGYDPRVHVAAEPLKLSLGEPLYMGFDFGHTPTCCIGQFRFGGMVVHAALWMDGGMKQLLDYQVMPWLARFAPAGMQIEWGYDPTGATGEQDDIDRTAALTIERALNCTGRPGPIRWEDRKNALLTAFGRRDGLIISPNPYTEDLRKALESKWVYPKDHRGDLKSDIPKKPNHPWEDLGDSLIYLLVCAGIGTSWTNEANQTPITKRSALGGRR